MRHSELFEFHDSLWFPALLRDQFTDALQAIWDRTNSYGPILPLLADALTPTHSTGILDLCSGAGGPWFRLIRGLHAGHLSITVRLTDKYPNLEAFAAAALKSGHKITFDPPPSPRPKSQPICRASAPCSRPSTTSTPPTSTKSSPTPSSSVAASPSSKPPSAIQGPSWASF